MNSRLRLTAAIAIAGFAVISSGCLGSSAGGSQANGCGIVPGETKVDNVVVTLLDHSQSTGNATVSRTFQEGVDSVLQSFENGDGGLLAMAPIDRDSLQHFRPLQCVYPHKGGNTNPLVYSSKVNGINKTARVKASEIINGPRGPQGTSLFDALSSAGHLLGKEEPLSKHRYLVMFSDMIENSDRMNMNKSSMDPAEIDATIRKLKASPSFPDLSGVDVYVAGVGGSNQRISGEKLDRIESFWLKYFDAAGATLDRNNYNPSLTSFP